MIQIYDSLTQKKQLFQPIVPGQVGIYVCGMTVYDLCHLGHARVLVAFDVITRYLRHRGYQVNYVRNITDVDDKILRRAEENGEPFMALVQRMIDAMHQDEKTLGVIPPTAEPRATAHIDQMLAMIQTLIDKGHAYAATNGDVYFSVESFQAYGKLSKKKLEDLLEGVRIEVDEAKHKPADFALWKAAKPGEVSWPSPWGNGRPGWHIECSAMSACCLGNSFDIHGGGPDLKFPHHENEIAQSEAANGVEFVKTWMHAGAVRVNKEKMSKSLGNFFTIREILDQHPAEVVRYFLVASHYRSQIDYSPESLVDARQALDRFYAALREVAPVVPDEAPDEALRWKATPWREAFEAAMDDDFNTPEALAVLFDLVRELNRAKKAGDSAQASHLAYVLKQLGGILGLLQQDAEAWFHTHAASQQADQPSVAAIESLIDARTQARKNKDFAESDRIRDLLASQGVLLDDTREGTRWRRE